MQRLHARKSTLFGRIAIAGVICLCGAFLGRSRTSADLPPEIPVPLIPAAKCTPLSTIPLLLRICACESAGDPNATPRQFNDDGSVLHGRVHWADEGECQISADQWGLQANALGDDLATAEGNAAFAEWLYGEQGSRPWAASENCWNA